MTAKLGMWPPLLSSRERMTFSELVRSVRQDRGGIDATLAGFAPLENRSHLLTTYGKVGFEIAVRNAGLAGKKVIFPAYISQDFVGILKKYEVTPTFVDVNLDSFQMDRAGITQTQLAESAAIVFLHTFGLPEDTRPLRTLSDQHNLVFIEDCARALGANLDGGPVGSNGDYSIYSLSKIAPLHRGGLLLSRSPIGEEYPMARSTAKGILASLVLIRVPGLRLLEAPGYRFARGTALYPDDVGIYNPPTVERCEPLVVRFLGAFLPSYRSALRRKREIAWTIRERLEPMGFRFQADRGAHIYTALAARVPEKVTTTALEIELKRRGIYAHTWWKQPMGVSTVATAAWGTEPEAFPNTQTLTRTLFQFPINRFLTSRDVDRITDGVSATMGNRGT